MSAHSCGLATAPPVDVSVVVVSYRTPELLRRCLASLVSGAGGLRHEVIVVDNDPHDGSAAMVAREFPRARLLTSGGNEGFARACNRGARAAGGEFVLLVNSDAVVHAGSIRRLVGFARRHPRGGLYGGRTLTPDGALDPRSCFGRPTPWSAACFALGLSTLFRRSRLFDPESLGRWPRDTEREVGVVSGCLLLAAGSTWRALAGFDPDFHMYSEDVDLSLRARRIGFRPVIVPDAVVTHVGGASSSHRADKMLLVARGKVTLITKHWSAPVAAFGRGCLLAGTALRALGGADTWRELWRRRHEWTGGYASQDAPGALREAVS